MPSPITAIDLITSAMELIGEASVGEALNAEDTTLGLRALNDVLETWSIMGLAVVNNLPQAFATVAGQAIYTVGPGGNFNVDRPIRIDNMYINVGGVDFPIAQWTLAEYDAVGIKTMQQQIVERFVYVNDSPLGRVILYPTPQIIAPLTIDMPRILTQVPTPATVLNLAPAYARGLQYAVAVELAPRFGSTIDVSAAARAILATIKRANRVRQVARFDSTVLGYPSLLPAQGF